MKMVASRTLRTSSLILGVAISSLFFSPSESYAGPAELKALATALNGGVTPPTADQARILSEATSEDLAMAVMTAIRFQSVPKASAYVGEALKRSAKTDFGTVMGDKLAMARDANTTAYMLLFSPVPGDAVKNAAAVAKFIGTSAKNATTGAAPFGEWVDEFVFKLTTATNPDQQVFDAAKAAISSKTAVGAIVGSRLYDPAVDTDAERLALAQRAILAKNVAIDGTLGSEGQGLTNAALEIARAVTQGVSDTARVADPAKFAADLLNTSAKAPTSTKPATQPLLAKITLIAPGVVAGSPLNADNVLESLFTNHGAVDGEAVYNPATRKTTGSAIALATIKNASKLATSIGLVADTEQYSYLAASFGQRVGTGVIKSSLVSGLAKALVTSMVKKPLPANVNPLLGQARDNAANRADEAGEIAAYLLNAITGNNTAATNDGLAIFKTGLTDKITTANKKAATSMVLGIIKSVVNAYNLKKTVFNPTVVAADVAGSVAQTLLSLNAAGVITNDIYQAIKDNLSLLKTASSINKTVAANVNAAILEAFGNTTGAITKYEDGTVFNYQTNRAGNGSGAALGPITEPETDIRGA